MRFMEGSRMDEGGLIEDSRGRIALNPYQPALRCVYPGGAAVPHRPAASKPTESSFHRL